MAHSVVSHESGSASRMMSGGQPQKRPIGGLIAALLVAIFAFQLNASMLSPALVTMQKELHTTASEIALTQTVFFAAAALLSLFLPRLADLRGRKVVLLGILASTILGCVISALAPNVTVLMIGRVFQGASGPVVPMCLIMLRVRVTDGKEYAKLMAILTSVNGGIAGVDAIAGGFLAGNFGFRSVFWTMAIVGVIAAVMVYTGTEESTAQDTPKMDWLGVISLGIAFLAADLAITEIQKLAQANWIMVFILIVLAVIFFVIFWHIEQRSKAPMVSVHYLKERRTWGLLSTTFLTMTGVFAVMNGIVPDIAQNPKIGGTIPASVVSFYTLTPYAIIGLLFGPVAGILASRFGYLKVLRVGMAVTVIGILFGIFVAHFPNGIMLILISLLLGVSYAGVTNIMLNGLGIVLSPKDNPGYLPGMNAGAFNLGAGVSFAVLYAFLTAFSSSNPMGGYVASLIAGTVLLLAGLGCSYFIPSVSTKEK